ncbi:MAG: hypothetical protein WDW38_000120 [Sanguina aurantia]
MLTCRLYWDRIIEALYSAHVARSAKPTTFQPTSPSPAQPQPTPTLTHTTKPSAAASKALANPTTPPTTLAPTAHSPTPPSTHTPRPAKTPPPIPSRAPRSRLDAPTAAPTPFNSRTLALPPPTTLSTTRSSSVGPLPHTVRSCAVIRRGSLHPSRPGPAEDAGASADPHPSCADQAATPGGSSALVDQRPTRSRRTLGTPPSPPFIQLSALSLSRPDTKDSSDASGDPNAGPAPPAAVWRLPVVAAVAGCLLLACGAAALVFLTWLAPRRRRPAQAAAANQLRVSASEPPFSVARPAGRSDGGGTVGSAISIHEGC